MSYFEIYQEKIRDLLAIEETFDPFVKSTQSHTNNFTMNEIGSPCGLDSSIEEDLSTQSGSYTEECNFSMSPTSPMESMTQEEYDVGFTIMDELKNNVVEFRHIQQQTTKIESNSYNSKNTKFTKKKSNEQKSSVVPVTRDPILINRNTNRYSSLKFGDAFGIKKETFLRVREHPINGPYVEGLVWKEVKDWIEMERLIEQGAANRTTHATDMNEYSSRSHALCTIKITRVNVFTT